MLAVWPFQSVRLENNFLENHLANALYKRDVRGFVVRQKSLKKGTKKQTYHDSSMMMAEDGGWESL